MDASGARSRTRRAVGAATLGLVAVLAGCGGADTSTSGTGPDGATSEDAGAATADGDAPSGREDTAALDDTAIDRAGEDGAGDKASAEQRFPDVVDVVATQDGDGTWSFDVTLSSPYDTPQRYADAWRVLAPDGTELGVRELTHDHANEQPFTRSLGGVEVPDDVDEVTVEGRDQANGWGGDTVTTALDRG